MDRAYKRSYDMLDLTRNMFEKSRESLRFKEDSEVDLSICDMDIEVNKYEREVRRDVYKHLVIGGIFDLSSAFILISIIIDIERIGDYAKNMVELALQHPGKLSGGQFEKKLKKLEEAVSHHYLRTEKCFQSGNAEEGKAILKEYFWINKACDKLVLKLVRGENPSVCSGDAVALVLYIRWLKRINSHLRNITTSVVNPFDRIGFEPKK